MIVGLNRLNQCHSGWCKTLIKLIYYEAKKFWKGDTVFIILWSNGNLKFTLLSRYDGDEEDSLPQKLKT